MVRRKRRMDVKKKKTNWIKVVGFMVTYLSLVSLGFIAGMAYQQRLTAVAIGEALSYTNIKIDVNFNETKLVQELKDNFVPAFKEALNKTFSNTTE